MIWANYGIGFFGAVMIVASLTSTSAKAGICPAVGVDDDCDYIIEVGNHNLLRLTYTFLPPYDDVDDVIVGVLNKSRDAVASIPLFSNTGIFAFHGDGIVNFGLPGNAMDPTGYGGPNTYFTVSAPNAGYANFVSPLPRGATTFFSLADNIVIRCVDASAPFCATSVPEPAPLPLIGASLVGLLLLRRRQTDRAN